MTQPNQPEDWINNFRTSLEAYAEGVTHDPQTNSVKQVSYDISRAIEDGELDLGASRQMIASLGATTLQRRGARFRDLHEITTLDARRDALRSQLSEIAEQGFDAFRHCVEKAGFGVVFTAHPTFALSAQATQALESMIAGVDEESDLSNFRLTPKKPITLIEEHARVQQAIAHGQTALRALRSVALDVAREAFPDRWRSLNISLANIASWVGYDLDGRTDIHWGMTFALRLREKAAQLSTYITQLKSLPSSRDAPLNTIIDAMTRAMTLASKIAETFSKDLENPERAVAAANALTEESDDKLTSLQTMLDKISTLIENADDELAKSLLLIRSDMTTLGLGTALVHLRVNASQVRSALGEELDVDSDISKFGRLALSKAAERTKTAAKRSVNFASLFLEQMTARRQFMLCAQLLKHVDADAPIRFLIAECEKPATIMGAIYLAHLYDVADKVDISPLFETPEALERGGRFMEQLLDEPEYLAYVKKRGAIAIQIGFSDSGRFMGQIAAELASERLQILVARAMAKRGVADVDVIIFNTHGESMGRGAHPASFEDRLNHLLTPWTRSRYAAEGVGIRHECSFQGGDGFMHFSSPQYAASTITHLAKQTLGVPQADFKDAFYADINFTWDVYRRLKTWHEELFHNPDYHNLLRASGPNLLYSTGSRKTRRQSREKVVSTGPSSMRAIPNNAIMQQFAIPANVVCGLGDSAEIDPERFVDLVRNSARMNAVMRLAARSRGLTSLNVLRAFASIFDASFWLSRASHTDGTPEASICLDISQLLHSHTSHRSMMNLATTLGADLLRFDRVLNNTAIGIEKPQRHDEHLDLLLLHAMRFALLMHALILAAKVPSFSRRHDIERDDILEQIMQFNVVNAADMLDMVFPAVRTEAAALTGMLEKADDTHLNAGGYPVVQQAIVKPLRAIAEQLGEITAAIANEYGAFG